MSLSRSLLAVVAFLALSLSSPAADVLVVDAADRPVVLRDLRVQSPELGPGVEGILAFLGAGFVDSAGDKHLGAPTSLVLLDAGL